MPPASTTPAWAEDGQQGGGQVERLGRAGPGRFGHRRPATAPVSAAAWAASAAPRATVRIVPSTGRMTASRASLSAVDQGRGQLLRPRAAPGGVEPVGQAAQQLATG